MSITIKYYFNCCFPNFEHKLINGIVLKGKKVVSMSLYKEYGLSIYITNSFEELLEF